MNKYFYILGIFCLIGCGSITTDKDIKGFMMNQCEDLLVNNDIANRPLGEITFSEAVLTDSIFKISYREKCETVDTNGNVTQTLTFHTDTGANVYTFLNGSNGKYFLYYAKITSNDTPLTFKIGRHPFRINQSKDNLAELLEINVLTICDSLTIMSDEANSKHVLYFENHRLKEITLNQTIN